MSSTGRGPHHYAPPPEKQKKRKSGNCELSFIITMLHHDVCLSAFEPKQKVVDAKGKYSRRTDITTHNTMPCPQRTKKKEKGQLRALTMFHHNVCESAFEPKQKVGDTKGNIEGRQA